MIFVGYENFLKDGSSGMQRTNATVWDTPARSFSAYQGGEVPRGLGRGHGLGWIKPDLGAYCESENRMYCVP